VKRFIVCNKSYGTFVGKEPGSWVSSKEKAQKFKRRQSAQAVADLLCVFGQEKCVVEEVEDGEDIR